MGRQKGDAARSKARPSSSSLAASLLPSGGASVGFGGYVGTTRLDTTSVSNPQAAVPIVDVDSEVAQYLKRLARKDPTTKLKALSSLSRLMQKKSPEEVSPIIPQWAFEYKKLLLDYNREVRRATHDTMANLVTVVGRSLAPHLKSLMGPWWLSQFDPVNDVSQAAKHSLQAAFPAQEKRLDALVLCTTEVFMYLDDILKLTPETMFDKEVAYDEVEEIHHQVISSALLSLATLLDVLLSPEAKHSSKAREKTISCAQKLLVNHKCFFGFLKSENAATRSSTYTVLSSYIKNIPQVFDEENIRMLSGKILGAFQEKDPACHSSVWDAILQLSQKFPDSWTNTNQKNILNQLCNFLRNGCFGSQQVSYPVLVLFIDVLPPKAIQGEKFFINFFQNLWAGRSLSNSSNAFVALFSSIRGCYLWLIRNASRFCDDGADAINHFLYTIFEKIILKLVWHDYLNFVSPNYQERVISRDSEELSIFVKDKFDKINMEGLDRSHPMGYQEEWGKCMVEILSGLYSFKVDLLMAFCATFEESCISIFKQTASKSPGSLERVIQFLLLVDKHAVRKGESWPLIHLVGPMLAKSLPLIKSLDSPNTVHIVEVVVSIFGSREIVQNLLSTDGHIHQSIASSKGLDLDQFLQFFEENFVGWCLQESNYSTSARLDLLLALLDNECLTQQWDIIIRHAASVSHVESASQTKVSEPVAVLALLLERTNQGIRKRKLGVDLNNQQGLNPNYWHHELLDAAALRVARSYPPFASSDTRFLCSVLGGSVEEDQTIFVARDTSVMIYNELLRKLLSFMGDSIFISVRDVGRFLIFEECFSELDSESSENVLAMAQFSLDVLEGSFYGLGNFMEEGELIPSILAAILVIDCESSLAAVFGDEQNDELKQKLNTRLSLCQNVHAFRCRIEKQFFRSLGIKNKNRLISILVQFIMGTLSKEVMLEIDQIALLCCVWILEVLENFSQDQADEQDILEFFLNEGNIWSLQIEPVKLQELNNLKFVALVDQLITKMGFDRVFSGKSSPPKTQHPRAWLAAQILCTWKWPGGSVLSSFLPWLTSYAEQENYSSGGHLLDSIINILLDGSLSQGGCYESSAFNVLADSCEEFESIKEPHLKALVLLFSTLFEKNIWGAEKAAFYFKTLVNRLSIGGSVNLHCLKILPPIIGIIISPLCVLCDESRVGVRSDSFDGIEIHGTFEVWLQKTLSLTSSTSWQTDMDVWLQLVISCYPLKNMDGTRALKPVRDISFVEKDLLVELFRKLRQMVSVSPATKKLPMVQMSLSKLIVVVAGYCWNELKEDEWEFLLYQCRLWIESSVVMMEEMSEDVNDAITNLSTSNNSVVTLEKLEQAVSRVNLSSLKYARNALVAFSIFCRLVKLHKTGDLDGAVILKYDKWDLIMHRMIEGILRLFFSTGVAEAIAHSYSYEASSIIASARFDHSHFWELVASHVVDSSPHSRDRAVKSVEMWGLSKGPISSLYAILFSSKPVPCLQFAAYVMLSSETVSHLAFIKKESSPSGDDGTTDIHNKTNLESSSEDSDLLREEICFMLIKSPDDVLDSDLMEEKRVNVFLAWSLFLSYLLSLPSSSPSRERLVQHIQNYAHPAILDCLFHHIPLESCMPRSLKKKELSAALSSIGPAAASAITRGSAMFCVESLWPLGPETMAKLACTVFGLMLCILPAYVRVWFGNIRNRSTINAVESFTRVWCSPPLITNELSQINKANYSDENFSVVVNKSANEVVATYKKDETGMDLVIRLPESYPLKLVIVNCTRSLGISEAKQRKWEMSMMSFVQNQNGALAEAIRIWKSNFDKEFEGVEECPICYSVVHTSDHNLPRLACKTCKHKFHSACLYKWFSTSHKSTCPLCQSPF
ncbi:E3 ubiquitin-protein ligase listerin isoform X2 [Apium graveolens]|uniref:E3 ubiquitin-protein ligase listerin isoform X2 n=1 Tax=Apium graveolens TaxID=4045 RepID=UPI003D7B254F